MGFNQKKKAEYLAILSAFPWKVGDVKQENDKVKRTLPLYKTLSFQYNLDKLLIVTFISSSINFLWSLAYQLFF